MDSPISHHEVFLHPNFESQPSPAPIESSSWLAHFMVKLGEFCIYNYTSSKAMLTLEERVKVGNVHVSMH